MAVEQPTHSWAPVDLFVLDAEPLRPEIGGLLYPGRTHLISGLPESMKSMLMLAVAVEQLRAGESVIWVDFEMGAAFLVGRLQSLGVTRSDEVFSQFTLLTPSEPLTPGGAAEEDVLRLVDCLRPSLVVFDAMTGALELHGLSSKDDVHVEAIYRRLFGLFRSAGAAVAILDHVNKDPESRNGFATGSQRKSGAADVHLGLETVPGKTLSRGHDGLVRIKTHKDRLGGLPRPQLGEVVFHSDRATGLISWELRLGSQDGGGGQGFRPTVLMERVSRFLESRGEAATRAEIEDRVSGKASGIRRAIDVLVEEGNAVERPGLKGARPVELVNPYRESDDVPEDESGVDVDELFGPTK